MKKLLLLLTLFGIIFLAILCKPSDKEKIEYKPPVDGTIVDLDYEDIPKKKAREAWFELMHQAEEGVDWKAIEKENRKEQTKRKLAMRKSNGYERNATEAVADGNLTGTWIERGSNNNAGNMITVNYLVEDDMLYGRSAGGTLWKGDRTGFNWQVINQDLRFSGDLIEARYLDDGTLRIIANLNHRPVYSDDDGITWIEGSGMVAGGGAHMKDFQELENGDIFVLQKQGHSNNFGIYRSQDNGESWERIQFILTNDHRNIAMAKLHNTEKLMIIEQVNTNDSKIHLWNTETNTFDIVTESSPISFANYQTANLQATYSQDTVRMYVWNYYYDANLEADVTELYGSKDYGASWDKITNLPTKPWSVGVYVSPSDHTKMMYGEVNPYRSQNGGKWWNKVSEWYEYYDDIFTKLHADIMDIKEFKQADGTPFTVVCNHGGVSQSFDYGSTYQNIGLITLNISQYYSVATHPVETEFVFAGSQDQGFQRGRVFGNDEASLDQVMSGDFGHIIFSGPENKMWTVYPWGSISYFDNPLIQGPTRWWSVPYDNKDAWIPPMVPHPDKTKNEIFLAGGSLNTDGQSHLIKLGFDAAGEIIATEYPFDFNELGGSLSAFGFNHFNNDEIYAITSNGVSYKSVDGGQTFTRKEFGFPGGHYLYGSCVKPSKLDPNVVYISGSGYSTEGVFKSTDGGESYQPMANGLPSTMVFCIAPNEDESLIFAATEAGPYVYVTALDEWYDLSGVGTPNQTYWSVEFLEESQIARFGTYGRGIWDFNLEEITITSVEEESLLTETSFQAYPNPFEDRLVLNSNYSDLTNVSILDQQGRLVRKFTNKKLKNLTLDLSDLDSGIYFVSVRINNKSVTEKIVKR